MTTKGQYESTLVKLLQSGIMNSIYRSRVYLCWTHCSQKDKRGKLPYLRSTNLQNSQSNTPSGSSFGSDGHQLPPGRLCPLTKNLRIGTYLVTRDTSRLSIQPVPVCRIYVRRPSGTIWKWKRLSRSTANKLQTLKVSGLESVTKITGWMCTS